MANTTPVNTPTKKYNNTPTKRNFDDLSEIEPSTAAVHCAINMLSPIKKSKTGKDFFDGMVTDGNQNVRIFGFNSATQQKLSSFYTKQESIKLDNCLIKTGRTGDLEILVNASTKILSSPRKFSVVPMEITKEVNVNDIQMCDDGQKVNLTATIESVLPARAVSTGVVQDIIVYDETGSLSLSVWEQNVDKIQQGKKYKFNNVYVRSYKGEKSLTLRQDSTYKFMEDITNGSVNDEECESLNGVQIIGIESFTIHVKCLNCSGKLLIKSDNALYGRCSSCKLLQLTKRRHFEMSATVLVNYGCEEMLPLKICTENLLKLLPDTDASHSSNDLEEELLYSPKLDIIYTKKGYYVKSLEIQK